MHNIHVKRKIFEKCDKKKNCSKTELKRKNFKNRKKFNIQKMMKQNGKEVE